LRTAVLPFKIKWHLQGRCIALGNQSAGIMHQTDRVAK